MVWVVSALVTYCIIGFLERRRHKVFFYFLEKNPFILVHHSLMSEESLEWVRKMYGVSEKNPLGVEKIKRRNLKLLATLFFLGWPWVYRKMGRVSVGPLKQQ